MIDMLLDQIDVRMVSHEWPQLQIDLLQQHNVVLVVTLHLIPCSFVARHATHPQIEPACLHFRAKAEGLREAVQLVTIKLEILLRNLKRVDSLIDGRGIEAMGSEPRVELLDIERVTIMRDHNAGFIQHVPYRLDHTVVVDLAGLVSLEVVERHDVYSAFTEELPCDGYHLCLALRAENASVPHLPRIAEDWARLDIKQDNPGFVLFKHGNHPFVLGAYVHTLPLLPLRSPADEAA